MFLAIDTSGDVTVVGVGDRSGQIAWQDTSPGSARHGDILLPRIQAGLATLALQPSDITGVAVGIGPGSFTGLRIGLATAQGWSLAGAVPVCGVVSAEALALPWLQAGVLVAVVHDAFKGEVALAIYGAGAIHGTVEVRMAPQALGPEAAAKCITAATGPTGITVLGNGLRRYQACFEAGLPPNANLAPEEADIPRPAALLQLACTELQRGAVDPSRGVEPLYVRDADAKLPEQQLKI